MYSLFSKNRKKISDFLLKINFLGEPSSAFGARRLSRFYFLVAMIRDLIIIIVLLKTVSFIYGACPAGSFEGVNPKDCFLYSNVSLNWHDAKFACLNSDAE